MWVEQKVSYLFRGEVRLRGDRSEGRNVGAGLLLAPLDEVTRAAPAFGKVAMGGVGRHDRRSFKLGGNPFLPRWELQ